MHFYANTINLKDDSWNSEIVEVEIVKVKTANDSWNSVAKRFVIYYRHFQLQQIKILLDKKPKIN